LAGSWCRGIDACPGIRDDEKLALQLVEAKPQQKELNGR